MKSKRRIIYIISIIVLLIFSISCKTNHNVSNTVNENKKVEHKDTNKDFYKEYSIKLGYELEGYEDMDFIKMIASWIGVPYKFGGCSRQGIDCSCFVNTFYSEFYGITLRRRAEDMQLDIHAVNIDELQQGDIIFYKIKGQKISHVGIYISKKRFVHASTSKGVMINSLDEAYYAKYYAGAGRVL